MNASEDDGEQHCEQLESLEALARDLLKESSNQVVGCCRAMMDMQRDFDEKMKGVLEKLSDLSNFVKERFMPLDVDVVVTKRAITNHSQGTESSLAHSSKIKVTEPKAFNGTRNSRISFGMSSSTSRELEFQMQIEPNIETWEVLKKELKDHFLPCNTTWIARESLKKLKHTGSVQEYVKEYMSEEDKMFNFLSGLQPWVEAKLRSKRAMMDMQREFDEKMKREIFIALDADVAVIKREITNLLQGTESYSAHSSKIKVPKPKAFNGSRNLKELEDFLWDVEQYFKAVRISDVDRVTITSMYLYGDGKLWWRTRMEEDTRLGRPNIETWDVLKKELKDQFLRGNTAWIAPESLKKLKHTGSVRAYAKEYSSLLLDIKNMSEEDKMFNFLSGLKPCAQAELRRQAVTHLPLAIVAAEKFVDYKYNLNPSQEIKSFKGLIYVKAFVNGREVTTMVDSGATNNFVAQKETTRLVLEVIKSSTRLKAVNSKEKLIQRSATVMLKSRISSAAKAMVASHLRGVMICLEDCPCFVEAISSSQNKEMGIVLESATRFGNSIKKKATRRYSKKLSVVTDLLKKDQKWCWSEECNEAFEKLKVAVFSEQIIKLLDFDLPFEVQIDASDCALGGVLVQDGHPIAFESRKLMDVEQRFSNHEKEMAVVVHCLDVWRHNLLGTKFIVVTNNVVNTYFQSLRKLTPKQAHEYTTFFDRVREQSLVDFLRKHEMENWCGIGKKVDFLYAKGGILFISNSGTLRRKLLKETHDTKWAGHPGLARMLALLLKSYYWQKMEQDIEVHVKTCLVCQQDKRERRQEVGLLEPLPIPEKPW
uniref:Uncharacterized protein n=1 Tax=Cannabis sativa TaxID=3483 RepID=A0A803PL58_CANSA